MNTDLTVGMIRAALEGVPDDTEVIAECVDDRYRIGFQVWKLDKVIYDDDIELVTIRIEHPIRMHIVGPMPADSDNCKENQPSTTRGSGWFLAGSP